MRTTLFAGTCAILISAGCTPPETSIPMASVSTTNEVMRGTIQAELRLMDPRSTFVLQSEEGVSCEGYTDGRGQGMMTCSDGRAYGINIPNYPTFSGSYTAEYDGEMVAIGWGREADVSQLRAMLN